MWMCITHCMLWSMYITRTKCSFTYASSLPCSVFQLSNSLWFCQSVHGSVRLRAFSAPVLTVPVCLHLLASLTTLIPVPWMALDSVHADRDLSSIRFHMKEDLFVGWPHVCYCMHGWIAAVLLWPTSQIRRGHQHPWDLLHSFGCIGLSRLTHMH